MSADDHDGNYLRRIKSNQKYFLAIIAATNHDKVCNNKQSGRLVLNMVIINRLNR